MDRNRARLKEAVLQLLTGDPRGIVRLVLWCMPLPSEVVHSTRLRARERPTAMGWVFAEEFRGWRVAVVLAPDGAPEAVSVTWARGLLTSHLAPGVHDGYTLRLGDDIVELELGPELAREVVERADIERLEVFPRAWSVAARERICSAVDGDRDLAGYGPPGWQPGPSRRQRVIGALLAQAGLGAVERAARLADLLLECGAPEVVIQELPHQSSSRCTVFVRFGDEVEVDADWEQLDDLPQGAVRAELNGDAELHLVGTAFSADISQLAPELLRALTARHRAFAELPFGDATEPDD